MLRATYSQDERHEAIATYNSGLWSGAAKQLQTLFIYEQWYRLIPEVLGLASHLNNIKPPKNLKISWPT